MALSLLVPGLRASGYRGYINYDEVKNNNREVITSFHWELRFTRKPIGLYFPPDRTLAIRLKSCTPPTLSQAALNEVDLHGWKLKQAGLNDYSGECSGVYQDFQDQSVEYAFREVVYESDRPLDHTARPKQDMLWDGELFQLNTQDYPIKKWILLDGLLSQFDAPSTMDGSKQTGGEVTVAWSYQMNYLIQMNTNII